MPASVHPAFLRRHCIPEPAQDIRTLYKPIKLRLMSDEEKNPTGEERWRRQPAETERWLWGDVLRKRRSKQTATTEDPERRIDPPPPWKDVA
ncbi:hypothetical protein NDU88_003248 [Pleurodeles waltl]|uniref:Uncharacterized protein n=1 Tax=Pleurodeles waltl TaxID=8319 RepID=A0AAV7UXX6_PLEWA|nr:hypothetical protein NDU88_003248 [Pleurodeles waltl]